jgi:hypothetical protein
MEKFSIVLPTELKDFAAQVATEERTSLSGLVGRALVAYLDKIRPGEVTAAMREHPRPGEQNRRHHPVTELAGEIGAKIKDRRLSLDLTRLELSSLADVPLYVVELAEIGAREFSQETIDQIMTALTDYEPVEVQ